MATMEFSQTFIDKVIEQTKKVVEENRKSADGLKQGIVNQKTGLEAKRNKLEDALLDGTIERDVFKRKHAELESKIMNLNNNIQEIENKARIDINLVEEVLAFTRNIYQAYLDAPQFLKRHYLRFFFEKIYVKNKKVAKTIPTPIFLVLQANQAVIIRTLQLPRLDSNQ